MKPVSWVPACQGHTCRLLGAHTKLNLKREDRADRVSQNAAQPRVTYVGDEAAGLLLLEELADARPGFALQAAEVRGGALVHVVHVLLLQLGGFMIHPAETGPPQERRVRDGWRRRHIS